MTYLRSVILGMGLVIASCMAGEPSSVWYGEYHFAGLGGETGGGSPIVMDITLNIHTPGPNDACNVHMIGIQKDETIFCTTTANDSKIDIRFKTYDDGRILNGYDVARYKVGEILFSLEKAVGKDKKILYIPHWASYVPFDDMEKGGKYQFVKTK
ncbi:MAG: hypothetical protein HY080_14320 [Gammaproteobacteria bacterium]|nr:hypothetical protein [Gammaproteobacteria bacterium]